jgi:hypothetical protein
MNLFFFNIGHKISPNREIHTIIPAITFSQDPVIYASATGTLSTFLDGFYSRHPKEMFSMYKACFVLQLGEESINRTIQNLQVGMKLEHKKMRSVVENQIVTAAKRILRTMEAQVHSYFKWNLLIYNFERLNPYAEAKDIVLTAITRSQDDNELNENNSGIFRQILTEPESFFICTENITDQCVFCRPRNLYDRIGKASGIHES